MYREYRDIGSQWLGAVPAHWSVKRLRFVVELNPSKSELAKLPKDTEVSFLPMEAIGDDGSLNLEKTRALQEVETGYTYFRDGDVTVAKITPCFENGKGALMAGLLGGIGFGTTELIVARPKSGQASAKFLNWIFQSPGFRKQGEAWMYGAGGQKRVPDDFVRNCLWCFPPFMEQEAISAFLDRETSKIDALITEQEKLLELLAEKRQATISHAVTRGLNPDVPLRDSGVEWLGAVPAHWEVVGLTKYLDSIVDYRGRTPTKVDNGVFLVTAKNIRSGAIDYEASQEYIDVAEYDEVMRRGRPLKGDVLFTTEAPLGQVAIVDREDIALAQRIIKFRPAPRHLDSAYLKVWIMGSACQFNLELLATGSTALGIKGSKVGQVRLCLPPLEEQQEIVRHINIELSKLSALDAESKRAIELLKERRSALISAAVTGKIDVREHSSALAAAA
jgi:type I restriction enzyme S subunit